MAKDVVVVRGYKQLLKANALLERKARTEVRAAFRQVGELVRADAAGRFAAVDVKTAAGYKVRVRQRGIAVEQSLRRTTGKHPEFGTLQMQDALLPALADNEEDTVRRFEHALDEAYAVWARSYPVL